MPPRSMKRFATFAEFYPAYLKMHSTAGCRRMHVAGNLLALGAAAFAIGALNPWALLAMPVLANGCASIGHLVFQRNQPGVFHYPVWGTIGNWVLTKDVLLNREPW
jgi:hypothetical protein